MFLQVSGIIQSAEINGKLPSRGVTVAWEVVGHPAVKGVVLTDADGKFTIDVQVSLCVLIE
jgi:hypothetical protein